MERRYTWQTKKKARVHILDDQGKTLCQAENNNSVFPKLDNSPPPDKKVCANCIAIEEQREPSLRVLMGEGMK